MTDEQTSLAPPAAHPQQAEQVPPEQAPQSEVDQLPAAASLPDLHAGTAGDEEEHHDESNVSTHGASTSATGLSVCFT